MLFVITFVCAVNAYLEKGTQFKVQHVRNKTSAATYKVDSANANKH